MTLFQKKQISPVVKRKIMGRASKVSQSEIEEQRVNYTAPYPANRNQSKVVRTTGLGRRRSKLDEDDEHGSISNSTSTFSKFTSRRKVEEDKEDKEWELVEGNDPATSANSPTSGRSVPEKESGTRKTEEEDDDDDTLLDKAADAADRTLLFIDTQIKKAVGNLNKKG